MAVNNRTNLVLLGVNVAGDVVTGLKRIGFHAAMRQTPAMDLSYSRHPSLRVLASCSSAMFAESAVLSRWPLADGTPRATAACCAPRLTAGRQANVDQVLPERSQPQAVPTSNRTGTKTRPDTRGDQSRQGHTAWFRPLLGTLPAKARG
jgi:hypothetical protein